MARAGSTGLERITLSRQESMAFVESCGADMVLITLRALIQVNSKTGAKRRCGS